MNDTFTLGVVIVTYSSAPVIVACLESLLRSEGARLKIVICDNASPDETIPEIRAWAQRSKVPLQEANVSAPDSVFEMDPASVTVLRADRNLGFAGGVNLGLRSLLQLSEVDLFWILNPDSIVQPDTAATFRRAAANNPGFGLMGGRIIYSEPPNLIQSDAGHVSRYTGICRNVNQGLPQAEAQWPHPEAVDFISGASMIASREFIERVGMMEEDYFLYYEEVDWAMRRGEMPIALCREALVIHHGGTAIGSGSVTRRASAFANYFNYRNRMRFMKKFSPMFLPIAYAASSARILKMLLTGYWREADGAFRGLNGLAPPKSVAARIGPEAADLAFRRPHHRDARG